MSHLSEDSRSDLARLDRQWAQSTVAQDQYADIPDGTYGAVIEEAYLSETSTRKPVVLFRLRITDPHALNRVVTKNRVLTDKTLEFLKEDLEKCKLRLAHLSDLEDRLPELANRTVAFDKRTKDGRTNFYFRWTPSEENPDGRAERGDDPFF